MGESVKLRSKCFACTGVSAIRALGAYRSSGVSKLRHGFNHMKFGIFPSFKLGDLTRNIFEFLPQMNLKALLGFDRQLSCFFRLTKIHLNHTRIGLNLFHRPFAKHRSLVQDRYGSSNLPHKFHVMFDDNNGVTLG